MNAFRWALLIVLLLSACTSNSAAPSPQPEAAEIGSVPGTPLASPPADTAKQATATEFPTATKAATPTPAAIDTPEATATQAATATLAATATVAATATLAATSTVTSTPTITLTPQPSATPTYDYPDATVNQQANCRYGPGTAYLYRWGLYEGDPAEVHGRNWSGSWLWIKPANLDSHCWASEIVVDVVGDVQALPVIPPRLPKTTFAGPPNNVQAVRDGNQVVVTWDPVILSDDKRRGYLLEVSVCQNSIRIPMIVHTDDTRYQFQDDEDCSGESSGLLYTAEKHGYSDPVQIPWP